MEVLLATGTACNALLLLVMFSIGLAIMVLGVYLQKNSECKLANKFKKK